MELVRELCSFEGRVAGTDAERRAANRPGRAPARVRPAGRRRAHLRPPAVRDGDGPALRCSASPAACVAVAVPGLGFGLVLFAATSLYLDLNYRFYLLRRLFFRRASQNVVSPGSRGRPLRAAGPHRPLRRRPHRRRVQRQARPAHRAVRRHAGAGRAVPPRLLVARAAAPGPRRPHGRARVRSASRSSSSRSRSSCWSRSSPSSTSSSPTRSRGRRQRAGRRDRPLARRRTRRPPARRTSTSGSCCPARASACRRGCARSSAPIARSWPTGPPTSSTSARWATASVRFRASGGWAVSYEMDRRMVELAAAIAEADAETERRFDARPLTRADAGDEMPARLAGFPATAPEHDRRGRLCRAQPPSQRHARQPRPGVARTAARVRARADPPARRGHAATGAIDVSAPRATENCSGSPPPSASRRSAMTRYMRWLGVRARPRASAATTSSGSGRSTELEDFWSSIWEFFDVASSTPYGEVLSGHEMPGARWFEGAELNYAEHVFRGKADDGAGAAVRIRDARARRGHLGGAARSRSPRPRPGCASSGVERGDRVAAYLPERARGDRRLPRDRLARRGLVELLSRLRRQRRGRPLRPDRAQGAARGRRLQLRRQGVRPLGHGPLAGRGDARA